LDLEWGFVVLGVTSLIGMMQEMLASGHSGQIVVWRGREPAFENTRAQNGQVRLVAGACALFLCLLSRLIDGNSASHCAHWCCSSASPLLSSSAARHLRFATRSSSGLFCILNRLSSSVVAQQKKKSE
jgi:hypothetical protein